MMISDKTMLDLLPEDAQFANELRALAQRNTPDAAFVAQLEEKLQQHPLPAKNFLGLQKTITTMTAVLIIAVVATLTVPPLRAIAQEIINLFTHATSDQRIEEYVAGDDAPVSFTSVAEAEAGVGIDILTPTTVPAIFSLDEVMANVNGGYTLVYSAPGRGLLITRQPVDDRWQDDGLVGASAQVQDVQINWRGSIVNAAYVDGAWIRSDEPLPSETGETVTANAQWLGQASARRLRWQDGRMLYEVLAMGGSEDIGDSYIDQAEMISIAESMQ